MEKLKGSFAFYVLLALIAAGAFRAEAYTTVDYYNAGMQYYTAKNFSQAIPYFTYVLKVEPNNTQALQGQANCYYYLGQYQQALDDYRQLQMLQPSPQVDSFIQSLQAKIRPSLPSFESPLPQTSLGVPATQTTSTSGPKEPAPNVSFGVRFEPAFFLDGLGDFKTSAQTSLRVYQQFQSTDPSLGFNASIPAGYFGGGLEPMLRLGNSFAIGLPFVFMPVGNVSETVQDGNGLNSSSTYSISAFSIGLDCWYFVPVGKDFQISLAAGPLLAPVNVSYQANSSGNGPNDAQSGTFSAVAFGGKAQLGLDWHLGKNFVISPFVGYQWLNAGSIQGSLVDTQTGTPSTSTAGQLEYEPTPNGNTVVFLANNQTAPAGSRAAQVDLSGLKSGIQLSLFF